MDINMDDIECFLVVAEQGSFTKAAEILFQTQPTVSRRIAHLESELGAKLFDREGKGLTAEGNIAYQRLAEIKRGMLQLRAEICKKENVGGTLRIGCNSVYDMNILTALSKRMHERYPNIELKYFKIGYGKRLQWLLNNQLDALMIVQCEVADEESVEYEAMTSQRMTVVLPTHHPLASKGKISMKDLKNEKTILWKREDAPITHDQIVKCCKENGVALPCICADYTNLKFHVMTQGYVTFLVEHCWRDEEKFGEMVFLEDFSKDVSCAIVRKKGYCSPELSCLWEEAISLRDEQKWLLHGNT